MYGDGIMLGSVIVLFMILMIFSMSLGVLVGAMLWTPPVKGVK
jgi:hypothetical protein